MTIDIQQLDWNEISDSNILEKIRPDIIIASDVVYDNTLFKPLCETIDHIFKNTTANCQFILAATVRNFNTLNDFFKEIGKLD